MKHFLMLQKLILFHRHWRVGKVDVHQTDEDHPRSRLSGRGEEDVHQAGLPEHLHGDAVHDPSHGPSQDPVRGLLLYGMSRNIYYYYYLLLIQMKNYTKKHE